MCLGKGRSKNRRNIQEFSLWDGESQYLEVVGDGIFVSRAINMVGGIEGQLIVATVCHGSLYSSWILYKSGLVRDLCVGLRLVACGVNSKSSCCTVPRQSR